MSAQRAFLVLPIAFGYAALAAVPALAQGPEIKLTVSVQCEGGKPLFSIVNEGEAWPEMANVFLLRTDNRDEIFKRDMRMRPGQKMVLRARELPSGVEVGLWIEPGWYKRTFAYDAVITCVESPAPGAAQPPAASPPPAAAPPSAPR